MNLVGRPWASGAAHVESVSSPATAVGDSDGLLPPPLLATAGGDAGDAKLTFLSKSSPLYLGSCAILIAAVAVLGAYDMTRVSWHYYDDLKANIRPPWGVFRVLGSRGVDVTDTQWYYLAIGLPPALPVLGLYLLVKHKLRTRHVRGEEVAVAAAAAGTGPSVRRVGTFHATHFAFGIFFALALTGPGGLFSLGLILFNYFGIAALYPRVSLRVALTVMWVVHVALLFLNYAANGYSFAYFGLGGLDTLWHGLIRWTVQYNISVLRMIAYNNDRWEAARVEEADDRRARALRKHERCCIECAELRAGATAEAGVAPEALLCYRCRTECCRRPSEYGLLAYLGYLYYPPLFMAGPISSFNAYVSHVHCPSIAHSSRAIARYGLRAAGNLFVLAAFMHYNYIPAILFTPAPTDPPKPSVLQRIDFSTRARLLILALGFIWLKLNVVWKIFRFFSLVDGMDVPENMPRCYCNTVNIQGFWRDWHASFNQWIVRYMYIPMGGSKNKFLSVFPIFFFVAIWHDIEMRLLFWAFFICLGFIPEIAVTTFFASKRRPIVVRIKRRPLLWRSLRIAGCQIGMFELVLINLVGFSIGTAGLSATLEQMARELTPLFAGTTLLLFLCAAIIAIQDRDQKAYEKQALILQYNLQTR